MTGSTGLGTGYLNLQNRPSFAPITGSTAIGTGYGPYTPFSGGDTPNLYGAPTGTPRLTFGSSPSAGVSPWDPTSDPNYQQLQADLAAQGAADLATLKAQQQRALIQFGEIPDFSSAAALVGPQFQSAIDPQTIQLAKQNTAAGLSTVARMQQQNTDLINQIRNNLAARGGLQSGETGYQLGRENTDYTRAQYDSRQKLLDYLAGQNAAYVAAQRARDLMAAQALMALQPPPGYGNTYPDSSSSSGGQPPPPPVPTPMSRVLAGAAQNFPANPAPIFRNAAQLVSGSRPGGLASVIRRYVT